MVIKFITHAYARAHVQYAEFLNIQLLSFAKIPHVQVVVCYTPKDHLITSVLKRHKNLRHRLLPLALNPNELFRRSIGRNKAITLGQECKFHWFTDADYFFHPIALYDLQRFYPHDSPNLVFPQTIKIQPTHQQGDVLSKTKHDDLPAVDLFLTHRFRRAIGGVQISPTSFVKQNGYVSTGKWSQPRADERPFGDFRDDLAYRAECGTSGTGLPIRGVFRLRHTARTY